MDPEITFEQAQERLKTAVHPRVTEDSIKAKIADVKYFFHGTTTICLITMKNGFRFIGSSTPASANNYDSKIGERYAYDNAFRQIWTHEGYLLREKLGAQEGENNV
jgi:hypothetical protein